MARLEDPKALSNDALYDHLMARADACGERMDKLTNQIDEPDLDDIRNRPDSDFYIGISDENVKYCKLATHLENATFNTDKEYEIALDKAYDQTFAMLDDDVERTEEEFS